MEAVRSSDHNWPLDEHETLMHALIISGVTQPARLHYDLVFIILNYCSLCRYCWIQAGEVSMHRCYGYYSLSIGPPQISEF